jgi:predicted GNAT family N-acyltransferase
MVKQVTGQDAFEGLTFKVASTRERQRVLAMRREVYAVDWPAVPTTQVVDVLDETAYHLLAMAEGDEALVGAARIVTAAHRPFDIEHYLSLADILPPGREPAEIGRLCVRHEWRQIRMPLVHLGILKLAIAVAERAGVSDLLLTALPKLRSLYTKGFFERVGIRFTHPTWGEVDVMRLDLTTLPARLAHTQQATARLLREPSSHRFLL